MRHRPSSIGQTVAIDRLNLYVFAGGTSMVANVCIGLAVTSRSSGNTVVAHLSDLSTTRDFGHGSRFTVEGKTDSRLRTLNPEP